MERTTTGKTAIIAAAASTVTKTRELWHVVKGPVEIFSDVVVAIAAAATATIYYTQHTYLYGNNGKFRKR